MALSLKIQLIQVRKTLDWDWGGEGGAILRAQQKKDFGVIPYFLVIADYEKASL